MEWGVWIVEYKPNVKTLRVNTLESSVLLGQTLWGLSHRLPPFSPLWLPPTFFPRCWSLIKILPPNSISGPSSRWFDVWKRIEERWGAEKPSRLPLGLDSMRSPDTLETLGMKEETAEESFMKVVKRNRNAGHGEHKISALNSRTLEKSKDEIK